LGLDSGSFYNLGNFMLECFVVLFPFVHDIFPFTIGTLVFFFLSLFNIFG